MPLSRPTPKNLISVHFRSFSVLFVSVGVLFGSAEREVVNKRERSPEFPWTTHPILGSLDLTTPPSVWDPSHNPPCRICPHKVVWTGISETEVPVLSARLHSATPINGVTFSASKRSCQVVLTCASNGYDANHSMKLNTACAGRLVLARTSGTKPDYHSLEPSVPAGLYRTNIAHLCHVTLKMRS